MVLVFDGALLDEVNDAQTACQRKGGIAQKNGNDMKNQPVAFQNFIGVNRLCGKERRGNRNQGGKRGRIYAQNLQVVFKLKQSEKAGDCPACNGKRFAQIVNRKVADQ